MDPNDSLQPQASLPLPAEWPGPFGAYKFSKQAVKLNVNAFVGWELIGGAISIAITLGVKNKPLDNIASYVISCLITAIVTPVLIAGIRRQSVAFGDAFNKGLMFWFKILLLSILVDLSLIASLILVVPFFFVWPRFALANYFLVDKNMGVTEAYQASWRATKGNVGHIYSILGAGVAMGLLAFTIIGIPFAIYFLIMYGAAHAVLYEIIIKQPADGAS